ncbi:hypothetical protein HETIRDRAFT_107040 [Heterobasidion irregulare TC 32-1]|uniref:Uncharacterized protein n=1 Tax=Heterobasidion irregulare (strain TC 32-1) TaxID=747525 RepID=W4KAY1_HETIT|nr:uncharacterized protein HETIRDRAFT_107040 [Heterobasidion irregulare TC 32-1]ETW82879.1 hypothetical protein HETIRDRAFT_107040 [Heterobasidion irregulare TC 32-1]
MWPINCAAEDAAVAASGERSDLVHRTYKWGTVIAGLLAGNLLIGPVLCVIALSVQYVRVEEYKSGL